MKLPESQTASYDELYRNIPTAYPRKRLFDESINSGSEFDELLDISNLTSGIEHERSVSLNAKDTWYKYGDLEGLDFCFKAVSLQRTRFSDGSYPVWYGAFDISTSLKEIEYHLSRQAVTELSSKNSSGTVTFERAMCRAETKLNCLFDVSNLVDSNPKLLSDDYAFCNAVGSEAKENGDSVLYSSARSEGNKCLAVFEKDAILSSKVFDFYRFIINQAGKVLHCIKIDFSEGEPG